MVAHKPTIDDLGLDVDAQPWRRSGQGNDGDIEVAFAAEWVLLRLVGDPSGHVSVFDQHEWACFLDGVKNGEFDDDAEIGPDFRS
jgi:hypothetical protein